MNRITVRRLQCGMPLITEEMPGVRSAAISWLVPAGLAAEPAGRQGLCTLWSEVLLRGAGDLSSKDHADALDRLGAGRSTDVGAYHLRIASTMLGTRILDTLPLLADMVLRPRFEDSSIEPARDLALQALESLKDDPHARASVAARARHFPAPFNRSSVGAAEGIQSVTRDDIVSGWTARARPGGSIMSVAGAIDPDAIAARLDTILKSWSGDAPEPKASTPPPRGYAHEPDETNQVQILVLHDAPNEAHADSILEKVVISVLSGGMAGRLFSEVREKRGLCYSVAAGYSGGKTFGAVEGYVGTAPDRAQQSLDVLIAEFNRINQPDGRILESELQRALVGMKSRLVFSGESTGGRAASLAYDMHRLGRPRSLDEIARELDGVTLERINAYLARRALGKVTIQTLGPSPLTYAGT